MKTLTKLLSIVGVLAVSASVFAHMSNDENNFGFMHSMMNPDSPQYQAMLKIHGDPSSMQAWMQEMHDNPEAMQEWMNQVHGNNFTYMQKRGSCFNKPSNVKNAPDSE
ncbi:MAG: hypothetical protein AAGJ78_04025 [Pseudomonadota bacterium]